MSEFNCPHRFMPTAEKDLWRGDHTCSYCGSLSPEKFFEAIEKGDEVDPTDKDYKAYVGGGPLGVQKFYFDHLSEEERKHFVTLLNDGKIKVGYPGYFYVMPFFCKSL